jgi:hypothetical protein
MVPTSPGVVPGGVPDALFMPKKVNSEKTRAIASNTTTAGARIFFMSIHFSAREFIILKLRGNDERKNSTIVERPGSRHCRSG